MDIAVKELHARKSDLWANTDINTARKALADTRAAGVEALHRARYFVRQAGWLQERFPDAELRDVDGTGEVGRPDRDRGARLEPHTPAAMSAWLPRRRTRISISRRRYVRST